MQLVQMRTALLAFFIILSTGIIGMMLLENLSFVDALYMGIATVATVGYGDIVPKTVAGKIFTSVFILAGVGMSLYTLTLVVSMSVEGRLKDILGRKDMDRRIAALNHHLIVCGAGRVGANVIKNLQQEARPFVVIEKDQERFEGLYERRILAIHGDSTLDEVMLKAGLMKAQGIITALSHDADNVYVTLTAKSLNPSIHIVARADRPEAEEKLRRAGADTVIFPSVMGGRQMVSAMTRPVITDFVENLFYNQDLHMDIAEIRVSQNSDLVGRSFAESDIKLRYDSIVVAVKRGDQVLTNPRANEVICGGDIMIVLGQREPLSKLNKLAAGLVPD